MAIFSHIGWRKNECCAIDAMQHMVVDDYSHPELDWVGDSRFIFITAHRRENQGEPMHNMFRAIRRVLDEHPVAYVSRSAVVETCCIVEPGVVIQTAAKVGKACIINSGAVVNHNSTVMEYSQVDCNAVIGARVVVAKGTKIKHA